MSRKRDLEQRLEKLGPNVDNLPLASLAHFLSIDDEKIESTDTEGTVRIDGELHRTPDLDLDE